MFQPRQFINLEKKVDILLLDLAIFSVRLISLVIRNMQRAVFFHSCVSGMELFDYFIGQLKMFIISLSIV